MTRRHLFSLVFSPFVIKAKKLFGYNTKAKVAPIDYDYSNIKSYYFVYHGVKYKTERSIEGNVYRSRVVTVKTSIG